LAAYLSARPHDATYEAVAALDATGQLQPGRASADIAELGRALATNRLELGTARRQMGELPIRDSPLKRQVVQLEQALAKARELVYRDELTDLPNRRLLLDRFNQAVARGARHYKQVAVLFLDIDGFGDVNDALGHATGDLLLQQVATRLTACLRASDTACRLGADEFVILLPDLDAKERAVAAAARIRAELATPYDVDGAAVKMTTSIGTAIYPFDGEEYTDLLRAAHRDGLRQAPAEA
jgi:diguanylate cyclase (GGDEF)-like protein